jgi:cytochrome c-type protein NapC
VRRLHQRRSTGVCARAYNKIDMHFPTALLLSLIAFSVALIAVLAAWPGLTATRRGKVLAFLVLFLLPLLCMAMGVSSEFERSKSTSFCLSCHIMEPHGRSLYVDDSTYPPRRTFRTIVSRPARPVTPATLTTRCSADSGPKLNGLHQVYIQYLGKHHDPIRLYDV